MNDLELVKKALENPDHYAAIIERYEKMLLRFVHGLSQLSEPDAEDVIQNVFLKAYDHLNDFDPALKLSTWLMRIARNEVIDLWRRRKVRPQEVWLDETQFFSAHTTESTGAADLDKK
ncbi:MAG: sigma-70 family RNA polymerase sigma factor, partial [Candidatus Peregrinibacteria bacterium]